MAYLVTIRTLGVGGYGPFGDNYIHLQAGETIEAVEQSLITVTTAIRDDKAITGLDERGYYHVVNASNVISVSLDKNTTDQLMALQDEDDE